MSLTLHRLAADPIIADAVYFVIQRSNGHWSPAAKILAVYGDEHVAEIFAAQQKKRNPHQHFGIAVLRGEAREIENPIEIVRMRQ